MSYRRHIQPAVGVHNKDPLLLLVRVDQLLAQPVQQLPVNHFNFVGHALHLQTKRASGF